MLRSPIVTNDVEEEYVINLNEYLDSNIQVEVSTNLTHLGGNELPQFSFIALFACKINSK
jgi:hypothetical protein